MTIKGSFALLTLGFVVSFFSCSKLNQPTELGDELIPVIDNVNTFDTTLALQAGYHTFRDTSRNFIEENMALGRLNDPVFGATNADMYFSLSSKAGYGSSPFFHKDSVIGIDSVVLQLAYAGAYGDTSQASRLQVAVSEIDPNNGFTDKVLYPYDSPGFSTGSVIGNSSFSIRQFRDSLTLIRKRDTSKIVNVLRIRLDNSLGQKLSQFDTTGNGPYKSDSLFRSAFRGLAIKTTSANGGGTLAYFSLLNNASVMSVYYRVKKNGVIDTTSALFQHLAEGQANSIVRSPNGEYSADLNAVNPQKLYIQSSPSGSYAGISVSGLSTFPNKVIHRAELIVYKVPSASETMFAPPARLFLDRKSPVNDSAYLFENDIPASAEGSLNLNSFGGVLRSDNSYRFNITRYVQGVVTRKERNDSLRIYAPLRTILFSRLFNQSIAVPILPNIASGRVVLAGVTHPDPALRMRLRIIYSNL